ncbi:MAG TPA: hypothetical protein VFZ33_00765 [Chitinophagaceae bacterium]
MTNTTILKIKAACIALLFMSFTAYSQTCEVDKESLKGTYTGDCKKNKAHGKGKAVGIDIYEGEFKNGVPDGQGTYTWANKNTFEGKFIKGLREGKGKMTMKIAGAQDSVVEGFWKKDAYIGKNEKPWIVHSKTGSVRDVEIDFTADPLARIKIVVTNTTGGAQTSSGATMPRYRVDNVQVLKGHYERLTSLESHLKSTETTLIEVIFPFRAKLNIGTEEVELEFFESGSYTVTISINK